MADVNSSLPVKTLSNGDVVVQIADKTIPSQLLSIDAAGKVEVKLDDSSGNGLTSQTSGAQRALDVGINVSGVQVDPRSIRALTSADVVTANQGSANATPWNENIAQIAGAVPSASNALPAQIATAGAFVSSANPLPVSISAALPGTQVNKYNTTASVVAGATTNHDYSITAGKTFSSKKFFISGSGRLKSDIQISADGVAFTTYFTAFNSSACPNIDINLDFMTLIDSGAGSKIRIVITNEELISAQDVYSTISGTET